MWGKGGRKEDIGVGERGKKRKHGGERVKKERLRIKREERKMEAYWRHGGYQDCYG